MTGKTYVFTNRVYPPVGGATGELLRELAEGLAEKGDRVIVITSRGPRDGSQTGLRDPKTKRPEDQETKRLRGQETKGVTDERAKGLEMVNGVELIRVGTAPFTRASHWRRALSYALLYPQFAWQVWKQGAVDAVVSMTDPPLQVAVVAGASCRARKRIHWAQDIYPELAEELGVIGRGSLFARILRCVSTWALRKQDEVVVVGRCMRERLIARGVDAARIEVIPNWSPVEEAGEEVAMDMRRRMGWGSDFVALYSGNIGLAHDFDTLIEGAKMLSGGNVRIVFAGDGPRTDELRAALGGAAHVSFVPSQPKEDLAAFLAAADVHLVTVRENLAGLVVPSKAYGVMATGRPIVYTGPLNSEIASLLRETGSGVVIKNGDSSALASALRDLAAKPDVVRAMGDAARRSAREFTLSKALAKWSEILS